MLEQRSAAGDIKRILKRVLGQFLACNKSTTWNREGISFLYSQNLHGFRGGYHVTVDREKLRNWGSTNWDFYYNVKLHGQYYVNDFTKISDETSRVVRRRKYRSTELELIIWNNIM